MRSIVSIFAFIASFVIGTFAASLFFTQSWQEVPAIGEQPIVRYRLSPHDRLIGAAELRGTWSGTWDHDSSDCTITFDRVDGNRFSGTLTERGTVVLFEGTFDPTTRILRFNETRVIELGPTMTSWYLGKNVGTLSAHGHYISGTGVDKNGEYPWHVANY